MTTEALALLDIKPGWLVRVTQYPDQGPQVRRLQGSRRRLEPIVVIGVVSQVDDRLFRVGSLAELGDGKSYMFKRVAMLGLRVEVLDRSHELEVEVVDDRPIKTLTKVGAA